WPRWVLMWWWCCWSLRCVGLCCRDWWSGWACGFAGVMLLCFGLIFGWFFWCCVCVCVAGVWGLGRCVGLVVCFGGRVCCGCWLWLGVCCGWLVGVVWLWGLWGWGLVW
ncbi:hypothetical protein, partial [Pseudomonas syringae group genomosp. 7]|uniref:hypothetical protein n=1 Tax=Pseudomonas syringae group genomosp. 7 TaxID=251699 RepID=UPI00376FE290